MCGRFVMAEPAEQLVALYGLEQAPELPPRYNIAPSQPVAIVRRLPRQARPELALVRWGLVPSWAREPAPGRRMINARSETVASRPAFRTALRYRRCLVPASGFYEWQQRPRGPKQPWYIRRRGGGPLSIAGIWERWRGPDGEELQSCALITVPANEVVAPLHDRMPALLEPPVFAAWLDPELTATEQLVQLLAPAPPELLEAWPVARTVNDPHQQGPQLIAPAASSG
ncbi:MAG: DUF159 family protein [Planctomycetota bacterium]|nr:MAG: DUF159 family protein [Planctomycetota bacterium]